jgi:hypothetical protein
MIWMMVLKVTLSDYNSKLISNITGYNFSYYSNYSAAENESVKSNYWFLILI